MSKSALAMKENRQNAINRIIKECHKSLNDKYGCLIPQGNLTATIEVPWCYEQLLGELKRCGIISSWRWNDREYENGNLRRYEVRLNNRIAKI